jgi:hypothetical protein
MQDQGHQDGSNANDQENQAFLFFRYEIFFNIALGQHNFRSLNITISC